MTHSQCKLCRRPQRSHRCVCSSWWGLTCPLLCIDWRAGHAAVEFHSCSALAVGTAAGSGAAGGVCLLSAGGWELITQVMSSICLSDCCACTIMLPWTYTHLSLMPHTNNNNTIWRGSVSTGEEPPPPLWEVKSCSALSRRPNPIPAIPPYVVRTPHLHGAPTTEETVKL